MSRRKIMLLSVAAAGLLAAVLMGSIWFAYFTDKTAGFPLPTRQPHGSSPGETAPGTDIDDPDHTPLLVEAGNIQFLLNTIERPGAYSQTILCVYYWSGGEETFRHAWARRGGLVRVETTQGNGPAQNLIVSDGIAYTWTGDVVAYHKVSPQDADAEALSGVPTWEDVAALTPESVLFAESTLLNGERCLRVLTDEPVYRKEYVVSMETGLLVRAAYTGADGRLAYECDAEPPVLGDPGDSRFILPDGDSRLLD